MKFCRRFYQRLYGFLSLLLLLQECHPAIRSGFTQPKYKSQSSDRNQLDDSVPYNDQSGYDGDWSFKKTINPKASTPIQLKVEHDYEDEIHFAPRGHVGRISKNASISKYRRSVEQRYAKENDAYVTMEIIKEQLNALSKKFMKNQEGIETKVYSYIESCSSQYSDDLKVFGSIKTPTGVIVRLMIAVIYTIANCQTLSLWVISEITEQIGKKTTFDMLQTFAEITDDLSEKSNQTSGISDDDLDEDMTMSAEESTFLSVLTAENILNTQEMLKLFHVLANNEQFENTTDLNEVLSELDTFSFTELVDKPNYRWIKYPTASETNTTKLGKQPEIDLLVKRLNSNATKRLMREISIPTVLSHNTDILVIYDRKSYKLLSSTDEGLAPTMRDYDSSTLPEQLWILDRGALINVASRLSIHVSFQHNMSNIVLQKHTNDSGQWYNFGGRLSHIAGNSNCFLDTEHNTSISSNHTKNLTIHCDIHIQDVELVIASFSDVNTPETLALHQPETVFVDPISKRIGFKFKIFMYLLGYMIMYLFEDKPSKDVSHNSSQKNQVNLEETFFIKHERKPCKVLTASSVEDKYQISFGDFAEHIIEYQLWYWKESQIINVATQAVLETNYVINEQNVLEENYAKYFRLWTRGNNTIQTFNEENCELDINSSAKNILVINCSSRRGDTLEGPWSFVPFDQPNFDNFQKVVCMFFIQTFEWPCEFISTSEIYAPSVTPLTDNIYSQLWYMSNGRLINIDLGLALTELSDDSGTTFIGLNTLNSKNLTTWYVGDGQIYPSSSRNTVLSINVSKNGTLSVTQNINTVTQHWKIVDFKKALRNEADLQCADAISRTFNPFVIRNNAIQACKMLTVVENNNSFELQMKDFDKSILDFQTWIIHRRHIINIATGLTIEPDLGNNSSSMDTYLMLRPLHSFQQNQMWRLDEDGYLRWHSDSSCCMHYHFDETSENQDTLRMKCKVHHGSNSMWNFTELPKYDDSPDTLDYMCMYFIKSWQEPCQFITANLNDGSLYLRPMVPEFIEKQLWVWSEQSISLVTTGHYFGASELKTNMTISELLLVNPDEGNISASWRFDHKKLIATEQETHISVDKTDDGQLFLSNSNGNSGLDLAFVHYNDFLQDLSEDLCGLPITETSTLFFIRSKIDKCKVLTGAELGKRPTFEHFNQDILESQLWFYEDNHLINLHSNLVLHVNTDISIRGSHVTMQNYYKYANAQKWLVSGEMIFFGNSEVCVLEVNQATYQLVICCDVHGGDNQLWEKIEFDDGSSYIDEITCMFFIRHEQVPCELLTDFAHTPSPALRPVSESSFNNQIWYWSGQHIINAATGLVLHGSETKDVSMRRKTQHLADGEWIINGNQVSLSSKSSLILGLNSESGTIQLFYKYRYLQNAYTKWRVIDLESGIKYPSQLSCESTIHSAIYLIKSEEEPCNVLTENAYGDLTLSKAGHERDNQAWVQIRRHIVSAKTGKALSIREFTNGAGVKTERRFEHELRQHWTRHGSSVRTKVKGQTKFLDSYNDVCIYNQDDSNGQKWTWHNIKDVEKETKLLRCSKCFDKGEEKANEVMSYIPIFGWIYSLIRAPVYAAKGCDDVAVESLISFGQDLALDLIFAAVTVLTAGTASAVAYGVKTGIKFGFKAGLKASLRAITSSIKLAVRQGLNVGKAVLKQGLKKTVVSLSKRGFTSLKYSMKSTMKTVKHLPKITKSVVFKTGKSVKKISTKVFDRVRSTTYGSFKSSVNSGLRKIPKVLKTRIKKIGNRLADNAERRIKKFDHIKNKKPKSHVRCKRGGSTCKTVKKKKPATKKVHSSAFIKEPTEDVVNNFKQLLGEAKKSYDVNGIQNAHFGLTKKTKKEIYFDMDSVRSKNLNDVSGYPLDKEYRRIDVIGNKAPTTHTEQGLLGELANAVRRCKRNCDELYMWTKNSPCMVNKHAKSCFALLVEFCYDAVKVAHAIKRCNIGFKDFYGYKGKISSNSKHDFEIEIARKTELVKNLATSNTYKIPVAALDNMPDFIRFYQIVT